MELIVFRSANGFQRHAEWIGVFERRGKSSGEFQRKVFRKKLPYPEHLENPESLLQTRWSCGDIHFSPDSFSGKVTSTEGDFTWNLSIAGGHPTEFKPIPELLNDQTIRTQIPIQGSWSLQPADANTTPWTWASEGTPCRAILQHRDDSKRVLPSVWFHSQTLREPGSEILHCAEGLQVQLLARTPSWFPTLTSICAFEKLKGIPETSLWKSLRARMSKTGQGWTFRAEQGGRELRGKMEVEPKHWITLRHEDVNGSVFYRSSTRMARLEILVLENGKPLGFFMSGLDTLIEWTSRERPLESPEMR